MGKASQMVSRFFGNLFGAGNKSTSGAKVAKDRVKIMIQQQRRARDTPLEHQRIANDVLSVLQRHWPAVDTRDIMINVRQDEDTEVFSMEVKLPKEDEPETETQSNRKEPPRR